MFKMKKILHNHFHFFYNSNFLLHIYCYYISIVRDRVFGHQRRRRSTAQRKTARSTVPQIESRNNNTVHHVEQQSIVEGGQQTCGLNLPTRVSSDQIDEMIVPTANHRLPSTNR